MRLFHRWRGHRRALVVRQPGLARAIALGWRP